MLVAIYCEKRKRQSLFKMLFGKPETRITTEKKKIGGGAYYLVKVKNKSGQLTEREAAWLVKNKYTVLVTGEKVVLPQDSGLQKFRPTEFYSHFMLDAMLTVIKKAGIPPESLRLLLYDPEGRFSHMTEKLLKICNLLKVVTLNAERYDDSVRAANDEWGAMITVSDKLPHPKNINLIFSPGEWEISFGGKIPVFAASSVFVSERIFTPGEVRVPKSVCEAAGGNFDCEYFLAAACELCPECDLGEIEPLSLRSAGEEMSLLRAAYNIKHAVNRLST